MLYEPSLNLKLLCQARIHNKNTLGTILSHEQQRMPCAIFRTIRNTAQPEYTSIGLLTSHPALGALRYVVHLLSMRCVILTAYHVVKTTKMVVNGQLLAEIRRHSQGMPIDIEDGYLPPAIVRCIDEGLLNRLDFMANECFAALQPLGPQDVLCTCGKPLLPPSAAYVHNGTPMVDCPRDTPITNARNIHPHRLHKRCVLRLFEVKQKAYYNLRAFHFVPRSNYDPITNQCPHTCCEWFVMSMVEVESTYVRGWIQRVANGDLSNGPADPFLIHQFAKGAFLALEVVCFAAQRSGQWNHEFAKPETWHLLNIAANCGFFDGVEIWRQVAGFRFGFWQWILMNAYRLFYTIRPSLHHLTDHYEFEHYWDITFTMADVQGWRNMIAGLHPARQVRLGLLGLVLQVPVAGAN